jgi:hypothetical protein
MDTAAGLHRGFEHDREEAAEGGVTDVAIDVGGDERRMHVRAYNHWVSLLRGRPYPSIEDLEPDAIADFGANSVLLDFTDGIENPIIKYLGAALRHECGVEPAMARVADVPSRSLLSRLTDHYLQIIANRAPIGFEAEFVNTRGHNTLYRGILMPFSSDGSSIDYIYGVINWKELVDAETQARLAAEVEAARRTAPAPRAAAVWADGPSAMFGDGEAAEEAEIGALDADAGLADRLVLARETAAAARASDTRSRSALYRALGEAYAFARAAEDAPDDLAELIEDAGIKPQARAPMTPIVKLVFGADYDKTRLTEFAAVLSHAKRVDVEACGFLAFLEAADGGIKGVVAAERAARRPAAKTDRYAAIAAELRSRPPLAHVAIDAGDGDEFVVLLGRRGVDGVDVVAAIRNDQALAERVARRAA